ncbi:hypothetical protein CMI42_04620 [Candidatus Pacearchaeota archaeon]|nr:hypothetical protein [Candidatus Pacearchaeota archaeon]
MYKQYASYFTSYLLKNLKNINNIRKIILFGSAAKDTAHKDSDIDIFIEIIKKTKKQENEMNKLVQDFYKSREALLFKTKGIDNKINIIVDKLQKWRSLKESIESTGIVLYGNYEAQNKKDNKNLAKYAIIYWNKINKNRGAFLNKLYGFKIKNKTYKGILEQLEGKRIGKSCIILPTSNKKQIYDLIEKHKVEAKIIEVYR